MTEVTRNSAMVREPTNLHAGDETGSSEPMHSKMPDLHSETQKLLRQAAVNAGRHRSPSGGDLKQHSNSSNASDSCSEAEDLKPEQKDSEVRFLENRLKNNTDVILFGKPEKIPGYNLV